MRTLRSQRPLRGVFWEQQPRHQNSSQEHHNSGQEQESSRQERKTSNQQQQTSSQVSTRGNLSNDINPAAIFAPATRRQEYEASSQEHRAMTVFLPIIGPVYETAFRAWFWGGDVRSPIVKAKGVYLSHFGPPLCITFRAPFLSHFGPPNEPPEFIMVHKAGTLNRRHAICVAAVDFLFCCSPRNPTWLQGTLARQVRRVGQILWLAYSNHRPTRVLPASTFVRSRAQRYAHCRLWT